MERTSDTPKPASRRGVCALQVLAVGLTLTTGLTGCTIDLNGDGDYPSQDGTFTDATCRSELPAVAHPNEGSWTMLRLDDVIEGEEHFTCGDGSPYKFFVQYNTGATDLTVTLEPGGACWDYATCMGQADVLNTVRLGNIRDDLMTYFDPSGADTTAKPWAAMYPHLGRIDNSVPTNKYHHVFFPYCTGDAFTGATAKKYSVEKPTGEPWDAMCDQDRAPQDGKYLCVKHHGHRNLEAAAQWLKANFGLKENKRQTGQALVIGSSAGAVGAATNYPLLRDAISPKCGAMVSDGGPIFPPKGGLYPPHAPTNQKGLLDRVSHAWDLAAPGGIVEQLDNRFGNLWYRRVRDHFGHVNRGLSRAYPDDRFLFTTFKQDLNFALFSFVGGGAIAPGTDIADQVLDMWQLEVDGFRDWIKGDIKSNWGYYLPNFRNDFCSHMVATSPLSLVHDRHGVFPWDNRYGYAWEGIWGQADGYRRTEIGDMNFGDALRQLLDRSQSIPRVEAAYDPYQLSFRSTPGVGVSNEDWYDLASGALITDKQEYIRQQRVACVSTNGYPEQ